MFSIDFVCILLDFCKKLLNRAIPIEPSGVPIEPSGAKSSEQAVEVNTCRLVHGSISGMRELLDSASNNLSVVTLLLEEGTSEPCLPS